MPATATSIAAAKKPRDTSTQKLLIREAGESAVRKIDRQLCSLLRSGDMFKASKLADRALSVYPGHRALAVVRDLSLVLSGDPRAARGIAQAVGGAELSPLDLGAAAAFLSEALPKLKQDETTLRLRAVQAVVRYQALETVAGVKALAEQDLMKPALRRTELTALRRKGEDLLNCFADGQCPPPLRSAAMCTQTAVARLGSYRLFRLAGRIALAPLLLVAAFLLVGAFSGGASVLGAGFVTTLLFAVGAACCGLVYLRERNRMAAWQAIASCEKAFRQANLQEPPRG